MAGHSTKPRQSRRAISLQEAQLIWTVGRRIVMHRRYPGGEGEASVDIHHGIRYKTTPQKIIINDVFSHESLNANGLRLLRDYVIPVVKIPITSDAKESVEIGYSAEMRKVLRRIIPKE